MRIFDTNIRMEFKSKDGLGVFWNRDYWTQGTSSGRMVDGDTLYIWICLIPYFPIHIWRSKPEKVSS